MAAIRFSGAGIVTTRVTMMRDRLHKRTALLGLAEAPLTAEANQDDVLIDLLTHNRYADELKTADKGDLDTAFRVIVEKELDNPNANVDDVGGQGNSKRQRR